MVPRPVALTSSESHSDVESSHIDGYRNENTQKTKIPAILSSREHIVPLNVTICLMTICKGHETRVPSANIRDLHVQFDCDQMQTGNFWWFDGMSNAQNFPADVERSHYHRRNRSHRLQGKYVCVLVMEKIVCKDVYIPSQRSNGRRGRFRNSRPNRPSDSIPKLHSDVKI